MCQPRVTEDRKLTVGNSLGQLMVGKRVRMSSLPVELLSGKLGGSILPFLVAIFHALLALVGLARHSEQLCLRIILFVVENDSLNPSI